MTRHAVLTLVARRLIVLGVMLVAISFLVFSLLYIAPGNAVDILLGFRPRTPATVKFLTHEYHLDKPFLTQYWIWLKGAVQFHFGNSIQSQLPVSAEIKSRLGTSVFLGLYAFVLTTVLGAGAGVASALRRRTSVDRTIVALSVIGLSTPAFVGGVLLLYLFAVVLPWFPAFGKGTGFFDELWHLTLPAVALSTVVGAFVVKHTRAAMISVLDQDFVTYARARGLSRTRLLLVYELRNALIPVVTISGAILTFLITGAVLVEVTFSLSGIGGLLVQSANTHDLPVLQGVALLIAVIIMGANLLADLIVIVVDPRIRLGKTT